MQSTSNSSYTTSVSPDGAFLIRVLVAGWLLRFSIIVVYALTDAINKLRLSPDSAKYHREGMESANAMVYGDFAFKPWIDHGWFQFTGLIYYLIAPEPFLLQLINITLGALLVLPIFGILKNVTDDVRIQRFGAVLIAFFPSVVYWSTLMLKDPSASLAIALVIYGVVALRRRFGWGPLVAILGGLMILVGVRTYLFTVLIVVIPAAFMLFPPTGQMRMRTFLVPAAIGALPLILGYGYFASGEIKDAIYFDLDYINQVRVAMGSHGTGALFEQGEVHVWGVSLWGDILAAAFTLFSVFIPVNPLEAASARQLIAVPFVLIMGYLLYPLARGGLEMWKTRRRTWPIILIAGTVLGVYIGGTTNAGALFRWTTQIMPYFLMAIALVAFKRPRSLLARFGTWSALVFSSPRRVSAYQYL